MGLKSFACFPNSDTTKGQGGFHAAIVRTGVPTEIEWPVEGQRYAKSSCSRRKNAVGLEEILAAACGGLGETDSTYHIDPQCNAHEQIWGTLTS